MGHDPRDDGGGVDDNPLAETINGPAHPAAAKRWGSLELRGALGAGAFGIVYRAWEERLHREVALKLILDAAAREGFAAAVIEEARLLARVRHPNVVIVHGADEIDGSVGIWMELIEGRTLSAVLKQNGPFSAQEAVLVGMDTCRALAAVHKAGLIHRDIKADNIMRESGGRIVVMDFGAGTRGAGPSGAVDVAGTPLYWAPELVAGGAATVATDIYSVGVLLYHLTTGGYPVNERTLNALREAHTHGRRGRLQDQRPDVHAAFVRAVEGALEPDPAKRFKTAGELQAALNAANEALTAAGRIRRADPLASTAIPTAARNTAPAAPPSRRPLMITGIALAVAIVAGSVFMIRRPQGNAAATPNSAALTSINSIAVLPFQETSGDENEKYLANAVPIELTTQLAQIGDFKTIPWTFTKDIAAKFKSLPEVVKASGADGIVEGSVQVVPATAGAGRRVRITVQLYQGRTGTQLWTHTFEDQVGELFTVSTNIADEIARQIRVKVAVRRENRVTRTRSTDADAMELYLRASDLWLDRTSPQPMRQALEDFTLAVNKDPAFAEAYSGIANCYVMLCAFWHAVTPAEAFPKVEQATARAIALDGFSARAWSTRAYGRYLLAWDWPGADADFKRALTLPPDDASGLHDRYAEYLTAMGRGAEAIAETESIVAASPQYPNAHRQAGWANYYARRYDAAIDHLKEALRLDPKYAQATALLARAHVQKGLYDQAIAELESLPNARGGSTYTVQLAQAYAAAGQADTARTVLDGYLKTGGLERTTYEVAVVYAALGDTDRAMTLLEQAYAKKETTLVNVRNDPRVDSLREMPRFQALTKHMKFPD